MRIWLKNFSAAAAGKFVGSSLAAYGTSLIVTVIAARDYLYDAPWLVIAAFVILFISTLVLAAFSLYVWLNKPIYGLNQRRYLAIYEWPIWRISWRFPNFVGMAGSPGDPNRLYDVQVRFRSNYRNPVGPFSGYIESLNTGERINLLVCIDQSPGRSTIALDRIKKFPRGEWIELAAKITESGSADHALSLERWLSRFDGFEFVFQSKDYKFSRIFGRGEIVDLSQAFWNLSQKPPIFLNRSNVRLNPQSLE